MADHEYIARISYGKDSLKMLEVIHSRGLPLDRITTTDVWATDTTSNRWMLHPWYMVSGSTRLYGMAVLDISVLSVPCAARCSKVSPEAVATERAASSVKNAAQRWTEPNP